MGFYIMWIISSKGAEGWDKVRSVSNSLDQHQRWAIGDVMWCGADDHTADSASLETRNQRPSIPCLHAQPYSLQLPFNPQRPHACQTHTSHRHDRLPPSSLPLGKPPPHLQTIVTAHHTSISNLTRNLTFGAKRVLPQDEPLCNLQCWA